MKKNGEHSCDKKVGTGGGGPYLAHDLWHTCGTSLCTEEIHTSTGCVGDKAYMRHGDDGCGCTSAQGGGIVCECGDGSVAGAGVGAPLHAHYVRGCAWECNDGFELDATGNACMVSPPPPPQPHRSHQAPAAAGAVHSRIRVVSKAKKNGEHSCDKKVGTGGGGPYLAHDLWHTCGTSLCTEEIHTSTGCVGDKAYMRHGDDGCGCTSAQGGGIVCECGDGSVAGAGVGAPLHAHYVRGCAWECNDGFELDATGNACMVSPPPPPQPHRSHQARRRRSGALPDSCGIEGEKEW